MSTSSISSASSTYSVSSAERRQPPKPPSMDQTASLLGMSTQEILDAQKQGETLADLAKDKGVSSDDLTTAVTADLKAGKAAGAPDLSDDQLNKLSTDLINGTRPRHGHGGPPPGDRAASNVSSVAQTTGTDSDDITSLLQQLQSGDSSSTDDLMSLLTKSNSANYGTSLSDLISGGLSVDTYA